jgi:hypothetical protein
VERRRHGAAEPTVKINGKSYVLATQSGRPVFRSGTRIIEGAPSDDFELVFRPDASPIGPNCPTSHETLATFRDRLYPFPSTPTVALSAVTQLFPFRWAFEAFDTAGTAYLYLVSPRAVVKVALTDPPTILRTDEVGGAEYTDANDRFGEPFLAFSSGINAYRWHIPANNGNRIWRQSTVNVGAAADTKSVFTAVIGGAAHGEETAGGKAIRALSDHTAGARASPQVAKISILPAGAAAETDANWGGDFVVGSEQYRILSLKSFDDLTIIQKENGYFTALEKSNGQIEFRDILPESGFAEVAVIGTQSFNEPVIWHNKLFLPTPSELWRHNIASAIPVGPDSIPYNWEDEDAFNNLTPRFGTLAAMAPAGRWLYGVYNRTTSMQLWLMVAREVEAGDVGTTGELAWYALRRINSQRSQLLHIQRNGTDAPRLFMTGGANGCELLYYMKLGSDRGPYRNSGNWAEINATGRHWFGERLMPCNCLFREVKMHIGANNAQISWAPIYSLDGATQIALGTRTTSGSVFFTPGTNDETERIFFGIQWATSGTWAPAKTLVPFLHHMTVYGTYLPDVSDDLEFVIDIGATHRRRHVSEPSIQAALKALVNVGAITYTDPYGSTGQIQISHVEHGGPVKMAALEGREVITIKGQLLRYT